MFIAGVMDADDEGVEERGKVWNFEVAGEERGTLPFPEPAGPLLVGLPPPTRESRRARAPKLIRRANGVVGAVTGPTPSPSSMAYSSVEVEPPLEMDSRRP